MTAEQIIRLAKREKALYDIALECFAELCQPLAEEVYKARLDRAIEARVNSMQDKEFTS